MQRSSQAAPSGARAGSGSAECALARHARRKTALAPSDDRPTGRTPLVSEVSGVYGRSGVADKFLMRNFTVLAASTDLVMRGLRPAHPSSSQRLFRSLMDCRVNPRRRGDGGSPQRHMTSLLTTNAAQRIGENAAANIDVALHCLDVIRSAGRWPHTHLHRFRSNAMTLVETRIRPDVHEARADARDRIHRGERARRARRAPAGASSTAPSCAARPTVSADKSAPRNTAPFHFPPASA